MSTKPGRNRYSQRRYRTNNNNNNNRPRTEKRPVRQTSEQIISNLIEQFNFWCVSLRTRATYEFDNDEDGNHRCKMILPIFPTLQSIGNGAKTKKESKSNAIIAFLAHIEKRKQVGLFVPYVIPSLLRNIQVELRRATVPTPDLNININEYLLTDRIISKRQAKKSAKIMKIIERICDVRVITLWQSANMTFVYIVGAKTQEELILPYMKALFQPDNEQMFNYGEKLFEIFNDEKFIDSVCQRLKVLCDNQIEKCQLFIYGSSVNVQYCYNEFVTLRREFESEIHRNEYDIYPKTTVSTNTNEPKDTIEEQLESTRIDNGDKMPTEGKDNDQLPDYSIYDDDVNASMLRVLKDEEDIEDQKLNQEVTTNKQPVIIEVSDDSTDSADLQVLQTIQPKTQTNTDRQQTTVQSQNAPQRQKPQSQQVAHAHQQFKRRPQPFAPFQSMPQPLLLLPIQPLLPLPVQPLPRNLRHIVLDGQNIARNSNDYNRSFSWKRLSNAINYFKNRGHENIIAFLPLYLREYLDKYSSVNETNQERKIRDDIISSRFIAFTPSRYNNGHRLTNYDDRFILQYAADNDGVVVSNDNFRDLQHEKSFQFIINQRILPFATINDTFMPATDPLGRNGPNLDQFLSKTPCDINKRF